MPPERPFTELMSSLAQGDPRAATLVWERFARRLTALAADRLPGVLRAKTDPESVVQSVFRSFFARHQCLPFTPGSWDSLWTLLTVLTVRKCGHRVRYFRAARRDVGREQALVEDEATVAARLADPLPTPEEALLLTETLDGLLRGLRPTDRPIVEFRLQGHTIEEVSRLAGCTERTVHRVLAKVRARLGGDSAEADELP
jgi:RNA polymerase sigma-70 factor (ECF subfamily)